MNEVAPWARQAAARVQGATAAARGRFRDLHDGTRLALLGVFAVAVLALAVLLGAFAPPNACDRSMPLIRDLRVYDGTRHLTRDAAVALRRDARQLDDVASRASGGVRRDLLALAALAHQARAGHPFRAGPALAAYDAGC